MSKAGGNDGSLSASFRFPLLRPDDFAARLSVRMDTSATPKLSLQPLPGFRDFYPAEHAVRQYIFETWRRVARSYAFAECDGPMLESEDLYIKKSGGELVGQLFNFIDKGDRRVTLRPEMTPTVARMIAVRDRDYKKPVKWFSIASFFRYEKQQDGRLREFCQLNCDLFGDASIGGEAELLALAIDLFRAFGLTAADFHLRVNDRRAWDEFLGARGIEPERRPAFLQIIDKLEREPRAVAEPKLAAFGVSWDELQAFLAAPAPIFGPLIAELEARGLREFVKFDATIVRGLAYYTGLVFEVFAPAHGRALAGGGRYDDLIATLTDGGVSMHAFGFAVGDVVLEKVLRAIPQTREKLEAAVRAATALDAYGVIADETRRPEALRLFAELRGAGLRLDYPLAAAKVGKQFQAAEAAGARHAIVVGAEWPQVKLKTLATREEKELAHENLILQFTPSLSSTRI